MQEIKRHAQGHAATKWQSGSGLRAPSTEVMVHTASRDAFHTVCNTPDFNEPIYIQKWKILLLVHVWMRFLAVSIYVLNFNF